MAKKHYRSQHWTRNNATGEKKPKLGFKTLDDALLFMKRNKFDGVIQPYVCDVCGMWHLGHWREKD